MNIWNADIYFLYQKAYLFSKLKMYSINLTRIIKRSLNQLLGYLNYIREKQGALKVVYNQKSFHTSYGSQNWSFCDYNMFFDTFSQYLIVECLFF